MHLSCQPLTLAHKILIAIAMCCSWAKQLIQDQASQGYSKFEQHVATCRWFISKGKILGFSLKIRASWQDSNNALVRKTVSLHIIIIIIIIIGAMIVSAWLRGLSASLDIGGCSDARGVEQEVDMSAVTWNDIKQIKMQFLLHLSHICMCICKAKWLKPCSKYMFTLLII